MVKLQCWSKPENSKPPELDPVLSSDDWVTFLWVTGRTIANYPVLGSRAGQGNQNPGTGWVILDSSNRYKFDPAGGNQLVSSFHPLTPKFKLPKLPKK